MSISTFHPPESFPFQDSTPQQHGIIKREPSHRPHSASLLNFQFQFPPLPSSASQPEPPNAPFFRFGSDSPTYGFSVPTTTWPAADASANHDPSSAKPRHAVTFSDEYDDVTDQFEDGSTSQSKVVRRRSTKACDQCRKSKCKCERSIQGQPCRNCILLGATCTFLGPSRKRGPPKGYIDAIEGRLHQTEALLALLISSGDERARGLLDDLAKDPSAKEILDRVVYSPYASKSGKPFTNPRPHVAANMESNPPSGYVSPTTGPEIAGKAISHPSNDWQNDVSTMLDNVAAEHSTPQSGPPFRSHLASNGAAAAYSDTSVDLSRDQTVPSRRQRRRVEGSLPRGSGHSHPYADSSVPDTSAAGHKPHGWFDKWRSPGEQLEHASMSSDSGDEDELGEAVGQLSLNEEAQVRFHGKASGLHLLGSKERVDMRNEGGIWRFPRARVWPPLPGNQEITASAESYDDAMAHLPSTAAQDHLLELYFTYVHPSFPIIHKGAFLSIYRHGELPADRLSASTGPDGVSRQPSSSVLCRPRRVSALLLLTMFSISARYSSSDILPIPPPPPNGLSMWTAGDDFLDRAKVILDMSYASSRLSTCQALLLLGYREIGIGAMAQAWTYVGMAIRMAQDLGLHRSADGWAREELGGRLFNEWELQERKRVWYGCEIMDKYVSTYIGRPLCIFERDFDTPLPSVDDSEETEFWAPHSSPPPQTNPSETHYEAEIDKLPWVGHFLSCFNASAVLSGILGTIVETIYAVRPPLSRHAESQRIEARLDKWYIELPEHLQHSLVSSKPRVPPPHILTLHMQYWCTVLLLHRAFIRNPSSKSKQSNGSENGDDTESRTMHAEKSYEFCASAANHITSIASLYAEHHCLKRAAVFLCYYIFSASIMHVTSLMTYPTDPQAREGLSKCIDLLSRMEIVWPAAGRALVLLLGHKVHRIIEDTKRPSPAPVPNVKRAAEHLPDDAELPEREGLATSGTAHVQQQQRQVGPPRVPFHASSTSSQTPTMSSYDRWVETNPQLFQDTLSTSVLPQLYSTGFFDERGASITHYHVPSPTHPPLVQQTTGDATAPASQGRLEMLPEYWTEYGYSDFRQQQQQQQRKEPRPHEMAEYGCPPADPLASSERSTVGQPAAGAPPQTGTYLPDHFSLYGAAHRRVI